MMYVAVTVASRDLLRQSKSKINRMGINHPPYSTYRQSFNFRSIVVREIIFDEKALLIFSTNRKETVRACMDNGTSSVIYCQLH